MKAALPERLTKIFATFAALALAGFLSLSAAQAATVVSVSFQGGDTVPLAGADVTGAAPYAAANWFNAIGTSGGPILLNASTGLPSGLTLSTYSAGPFGVNGPDGDNSTAQARLFGGSLGVNFGPSTFTVTGLSAFSTYDLLVYYTGGTSFPADRHAEISTSASATTFYVAGINSVLTAFTQSASTSSSTYASGNYVLYTGLTAATATVTMANSNNNTGLVGFQISGTPIPEPSTFSLLLLTGAALSIRRRRPALS